MPTALGGRIRTFTGRLLLWHALVVIAILLVLGVTVDRVLEGYLVDQLTDSLEAEARVVQASLPSEVPAVGSLEPDVASLGLALGARVTLIRIDGVVLADSEEDPAVMDNHRDRPEVLQALAGHVGRSSRISATVGISFRYVALPPRDGVIVRVALPLTSVASKLRAVRSILLVGFGLAAAAGLLALALTARGVSRPLRSITTTAERLGTGDLGTAIEAGGSEELVTLARTLDLMRLELSTRIQAAERARQARDTTLAALEEGVMLIDRTGEVLYGNPSADALLGGPTSHVRHLAPPELRSLADRVATGGTATVEVVTATTPPRTLRAVASSIPEEGNVVLVLHDVTGAQRLDAVRRDFVANASHELKTPIASIQALAETIASASADDPDSVPRFAGQLEREAVRLSRIISDLLDLSRLEGGTGGMETIRLDRLVLEEAAPYRDRAIRAHVTMTVSAGAPVRIRGSERDLGLMVRNLVENAVQYTRAGGTVEVAVSVDGDRAVLEVADTGIGIPQRDQGRVFERFYRVDRARSRETGGTGLGLSIVRHVVENHGGRVELESELGRGSRFTVRLPLGPEPA